MKVLQLFDECQSGLVSLYPEFPFWHPHHSSINTTSSFARAILHSRRQRAIWQPGVRLREGVNRHLDPFPMRFLGHLAILPSCFLRISAAGSRLAGPALRRILGHHSPAEVR
jgi:hypothetical protein